MQKKSIQAFSLLELSTVIIVIGLLVAGIMSGKRMMNQAALRSAQALTKSSAIASIPDLKLWLEPTLTESVTGANGNNLSNNDLVSYWNDISGNKINPSQSTLTPSNQPQYLTSGINGLPSIKFDGNDALYSTTVPIDISNGRYTMVAVWKPYSVTGDQVVIGQKATGASPANQSAEVWLSTNTIRFGGQANDTASLGNIAINGIYIGIMVVNNTDSAGNVSLYLNTNTKSQLNSGSPSTLNLGADFFEVGAKVISAGSYGNYSNGLISEVLIFNRNLKPTEVNLINNYLSKKYNITVS
ncbi:MAG: LamG-like jellyroll fold domain-containing protein [Pseudomonadota bacterium]